MGVAKLKPCLKQHQQIPASAPNVSVLMHLLTQVSWSAHLRGHPGCSLELQGSTKANRQRSFSAADSACQPASGLAATLPAREASGSSRQAPRKAVEEAKKVVAASTLLVDSVGDSGAPGSVWASLMGTRGEAVMRSEGTSAGKPHQ